MTLAARKAVRDLLCESDFAHYNFFAPIHENPRGRTCQDRLNGFASNFGRNTGEWFQNIKSCGLDEYAIKVYETYIDIVKVYDAMAKFAQLDVSFIDKYEQGFSEGIAGPKYRSQRTSNQRPYSFMQAGRYFPQKETSCEQQREFFNSSKSETWTEDLDGDVDSMEEELFNLGLSIGGYWDLGPSGIFPENCRRR